MTSGGEPLSEERIHLALKELGFRLLAPHQYAKEAEILRAFAREILQSAEFEKGCECDSCCRLEELRVKVHLPEGSADEIAGSLGKIMDGQLETLQELWPLQDKLLASQEREKALAEALEKISMWETPWPERDPGYGCFALMTARMALSAYRDSGRGEGKP